MRLTGLRTLTFGLAALFGLLLGLWLVPAEGRGAVYGFFAAGVAGLMTAVATKSAVAKLADGGGTGGAWAALTTPAKPGDPAAP